MAFELPELPYDYEALQPFMSKETPNSITTSTTRLMSTTATSLRQRQAFPISPSKTS